MSVVTLHTYIYIYTHTYSNITTGPGWHNQYTN